MSQHVANLYDTGSDHSRAFHTSQQSFLSDAMVQCVLKWEQVWDYEGVPLET